VWKATEGAKALKKFFEDNTYKELYWTFYMI